MNIGEWISSGVSQILSSIAFWFCSLWYSLFSAILKLCDVIKTSFNKFVGIETFEGESSDIITQALNSTSIKNILVSLIVLCIIMMMVLTIISIVRNVYSKNKLGWKQILLNNLKGFIGFFAIPVVCVFGISIGNVILRAIDGATALGNNYSISTMLFSSTTIDSDYISVLLDSDDPEDYTKACELASYYCSSDVGELYSAIEYYYRAEHDNEEISEISLKDIDAESIKEQSGTVELKQEYLTVGSLYSTVTSYSQLLTYAWGVQDVDSFDYASDIAINPSHTLYFTDSLGNYVEVPTDEVANFSMDKNITNYILLHTDTMISNLEKFGLVAKISDTLITGFNDNFVNYFNSNTTSSFTISTKQIANIIGGYSGNYTVKYSIETASNSSSYLLKVKYVACFYSIKDINLFFAIVGSLFMGYALVVICIGLLKRMFNIVFLYVLSPIPLAMIPLSGETAFNSWKSDFIKNVIAGYSAVAGLNIYFSIYDVFNNITYSSTAFWNMFLKFFVFVVGLMSVNEIIEKITSYIGGTNLFSQGKATWNTFRSGMGNATKIVTTPIVQGTKIVAGTYAAARTQVDAGDKVGWSKGKTAARAVLHGGKELAKGTIYTAGKALGADIETSVNNISSTAVNTFRSVEKSELEPINELLRNQGNFTLSGRNGYREFLQNQTKSWGAYYRNVMNTFDTDGNKIPPEMTEEAQKYIDYKVPFAALDRDKLLKITELIRQRDNVIADQNYYENVVTTLSSLSRTPSDIVADNDAYKRLNDANEKVDSLKRQRKSLNEQVYAMVDDIIWPIRKNNIKGSVPPIPGTYGYEFSLNTIDAEYQQIKIDEDNARQEYKAIMDGGFKTMVKNKAFTEYLKKIHRDNKYH